MDEYKFFNKQRTSIVDLLVEGIKIEYRFFEFDHCHCLLRELNSRLSVFFSLVRDRRSSSELRRLT